VTLLAEEQHGVLRLTLNRPEAMNALTSDLRRALTAAIRGASARVIVITGAGRGFCAGQDLAELNPEDVDLEAVLTAEYVPLIEAIVRAPMPVIAAVNGVAAGAGANLALACDVVIAAESASFIQAFARIGLVPDAGGSHFLPAQVGLPRALGAVLFAEPVPARQAEAWGMIWAAVPDEDFPGVVSARAAQLAEGPALALAEAKKLLRAAGAEGLAAQLTREAAAQARAGAHPDFAEGVAAFRQKRKPRFH
jgi:2-(1,2-epoxy-1,2-dihydrophenyl)acetyl-CoA isomerase